MNWKTHHIAFRNKTGVWRIRYFDRSFHAFYEDESLGAYCTPEQAFDDLVHGHTFWPEAGDPTECGLPKNPGHWRVASNREPLSDR